MSVKAAAGRLTVLVAALVSVLLAMGGGLAHADPLAGKTYADAVSTASGWGSKVIISTVVGGSLATDDCIVTSSQKAPSINDNFDHRSGYLVSLNCGAPLAKNGASGNSVMTPEGKAAKKDLKSVEWINDTPEGAQWCSENVKDCNTLCTRTSSCSSETLSSIG